MRIKICGITRCRDGLAAAAAGADAIGLVFVKQSPRAVSLEQARAICRALPPFVARVGLFMDAPAESVRQVLAQVPIDWLQFHGREPLEFCTAFERPWIRALAMGGDEPAAIRRFAAADYLLLDAHRPGKMGGSGETFDWGRVPKLDRPWILAGGLTPANVGDACRILRPDAVDVSSGVEASPGIKSDKLIYDFVKAARNG